MREQGIFFINCPIHDDLHFHQENCNRGQKLKLALCHLSTKQTLNTVEEECPNCKLAFNLIGFWTHACIHSTSATGMSCLPLAFQKKAMAKKTIICSVSRKTWGHKRCSVSKQGHNAKLWRLQIKWLLLEFFCYIAGDKSCHLNEKSIDIYC